MRKQIVHKSGVLNLPAGLQKELDAIAVEQRVAKRWTDESEAILIHYYTNEEASINTLCKILAKAFPDKKWPYATVGSKVQSLKNAERLEGDND